MPTQAAVLRNRGGAQRRSRLYEEALAVIELRRGDPRLSVGRIAASVFTSPRQLQRAFHEQGVTVRAAVAVARMEHAQALLRESALSAGEVGRLVGYEDPAQFSKAFSRQFGVPPGEWRRRYFLGASTTSWRAAQS